MTIEQRENIINLLKNVINDEGSAKVSWAIREVLGKDSRPTLSEIEKISASLIATGEFERTRRGVEEEYYVFKNPQYQLNESLIKTNNSIRVLNEVILPENFKSQDKFGKRSLILAFISVLFIAITAYLQWSDQKNSELKEIKLEIEKSGHILDSINTHYKSIDSSLKKISRDTSRPE